jgi:hypothetical protein
MGVRPCWCKSGLGCRQHAHRRSIHYLRRNARKCLLRPQRWRFQTVLVCRRPEDKLARCLVDDTVAPSSRAQAQDPAWSNYKWNQNDVFAKMLDASTQVGRGMAELGLFVATTATSEQNPIPPSFCAIRAVSPGEPARARTTYG